MKEHGPSRASMLAAVSALSLSAWITSAVAADIDSKIWDAWNKATAKQCPSHHLEMLGGVYDTLIDGFATTLSRDQNEKSDKIANYKVRCADEEFGFDCYGAVYMDAYKRLGVLDRLAAYACHRYKCLGGALCVDPRTGKL